MPTFNAADIIGKTLVAKTQVPLLRLPNDDAPTVYTVAPGQSLGVVQSFLLPGTNRTNLYWQFKDQNNNFYYSEHKQGIYDVKELANQGALTLEQQQAAAIEANLTTGDKIFRLIKNTLFIGAGVYLINTIIKKKL
jgi:hypothetical protein